MITISEVSATIKREWVTHILREIMDSDKLSIGAKVTYAILCGYRGKNCREPFPSLPTLSNKVGSCRQTVQRYLDELEDAGVITSMQRRKGGAFDSNGYQINDGINGSPQLKKLTTVEGLTVVKKHRYGKTSLRRNLTTKESQHLKDSHSLKDSHKEREKEVAFSSMAEAIDYYKSRFPEIPVKASLSRMRALKEKKGENWRLFLNTAYLDDWFARETARIPPKKQPAERKEEGRRPENSEPQIEHGPEAVELFNQLRDQAGVGKNVAKAVEAGEQTEEERRRRIRDAQVQYLHEKYQK
jgi:Helix-turn-helix domain